MTSRHHLAAIFLAVSISLTGFATAQETTPSAETATIAADQVDVSLEALPILLVPMTAEDLAGLADTWQGYSDMRQHEPRAAVRFKRSIGHKGRISDLRCIFDG